MSRRIVKVLSSCFEWPVNATRPSTYAIDPARLDAYLARTGVAHIAEAEESALCLLGNTAGPHGRSLTEAELVACYANEPSYERFFASEGHALLAYERN